MVFGPPGNSERQTLQRAARAAVLAADKASMNVNTRSSSTVAFAAARAAAYSPDSALNAKAAVLSTSRSIEKASDSRLYVTALERALSEDTKHSISQLLHRTLWGSVSVPKNIAENHETFLAYLAANDDWAFWRRWYSEMWHGEFTNWDLAIEVALIPDVVWEGEDALAKVAKAIRGIEARLALKSAISKFRDSTKTVVKEEVLVHRGHNNPPELIDEPDHVGRREIVWAAIDALEQEVERDSPDRWIVRRSIDAIANWVSDVLRYFGRKADLTIDQAIRWGVPMGGAYLLANPAQLQRIIEAGKAWLPFVN
ncbi:hypothetical protein [uncultured Tateyamaria sp.]|nr:hypothetical protein [uncultured Tateyamaria sp.]